MADDRIRTGNIRASQIRVTLVAVLGVVLLAYGVYQVGKLFDVFADRYPLYTRVATVAGLMEGSAVTLAGQRVGQVTEIRFLPVGDQEGQANILIRLSLNRGVQSQIRADSRATIRTQGLLGDRFVDIRPGSAEAPPLEPGDTVTSQPAMDLEEVMITAAATLDSVRLVIDDLKVITGRIARGQGSLGKLIEDPVLYDRLATATDEMATVLGTINRGDGALSRMLHDPTMYDRMSRSVARLDSLAARVLAGRGTMGRLFIDERLFEDLSATVARTDTTMAGMQRIVTEVAEGDGSLHRLVAEPELYDALLEAIVELQSVIRTIREDPSSIRPSVTVDVF